MTGSDRLRSALADVGAALGLLTRLPLPQGAQAPRGPGAAWAWPVAGALVGALAALGALLALRLGLPLGVAAAVALSVQAMVTGAMHEDGLADTADGFWGGWDKARRLAIMKDSHIGTYGVLALLLVALARWSALVALLAAGAQAPVLIAVGALSRAPMIVLMANLPNARGSGLAQSVGQPEAPTAALAAGLALGLALILTGWTGLAMACGAAGLCLALAFVARAKIGGQTGDVLGASQQLAEVAALALAAACLA
jgi:adenosylcobinamide-GDP ribazoletransferase